MRKIILHLKAWNLWRKYSRCSKIHKLLVLLGLSKSPTMVFAYFQIGLEHGFKHWETKIPKMRPKKLQKKTDIDTIDNFLNEDITIRPYTGGNKDD